MHFILCTKNDLKTGLNILPYQKILYTNLYSALNHYYIYILTPSNQTINAIPHYMRVVICQIPYKKVNWDCYSKEYPYNRIFDTVSKRYKKNDVLILSELYNLFDIKTIKKFGLSKCYGKWWQQSWTKDKCIWYISELYINDKMDILDYLFRNNKLTGYEEHIIKNITQYNKDHVFLEWWKDRFSNLKNSYSKDVMYDISRYHNLEQLKWWFDSGLPILYDENVLNIASELGHVDILQIWKNSGLPLKYTRNVLNKASENGHASVLTWWLESGLPLEYDESALDLASRNGHANVLKWWINSGLELKYSTEAIDNASVNGHIKILNVWANSGLELKYTAYAIDHIATQWNTTAVNTLKWWFKSNLPLKYSNNAILTATRGGRIDILNLWVNSGLDLKYSRNILAECAPNLKYNERLQQWWANSGLLSGIKN